MSMSDLERALGLIEASAVADFAGPKSELLIKSAETALGLKFPPTYRKFLSRAGAGAIGGAEFYGIIKNDFRHSSVPDAIWLTLRHRMVSAAPASLVIVAGTGDGGYYAIDTSQGTADNENPVIEWWPGLPNATENGQNVAVDFGSFFLERVQQNS